MQLQCGYDSRPGGRARRSEARSVLVHKGLWRRFFVPGFVHARIRRQGAEVWDLTAGAVIESWALGAAAQVSASVPLQQLASAEWKRLGRDASSAADFLVLQAFDQCMGAKHPAPSIGLTHLNEALQTAGSILPLNRVVVALGWHGWDFRCRGAAGNTAPRDASKRGSAMQA